MNVQHGLYHKPMWALIWVILSLSLISFGIPNQFPYLRGYNNIVDMTKRCKS